MQFIWKRRDVPAKTSGEKLSIDLASDNQGFLDHTAHLYLN